LHEVGHGRLCFAIVLCQTSDGQESELIENATVEPAPRDIAALPPAPPAESPDAERQRSFAERRRTADLVFRGALIFNAVLTLFWVSLMATGQSSIFFKSYTVDLAALGRVAAGIGIFYLLWGFIWYGIKSVLLRYWAGLTKDERRQVFASRMDAPFDVSAMVARHSERRIRIIDMIGRRGRFATIAAAGFFYLYLQIARTPTADFATLFLSESLFDAMAIGWIQLAFFYRNGVLAAAFYGPQARIMDGVLGRANCLLIMTLWTAFKFVMVPLGTALAGRFAPTQFAVVFALIWGSYLVTDGFAEVGGSLFGRQRIRVRGVGDVNRKSVAGIVSGFVACLVFSVGLVLLSGLPAAWMVLALVLSVANTVLELFSPRGTDDFTMATANALICLGFGTLVA
jgi:hypothetical protein